MRDNQTDKLKPCPFCGGEGIISCLFRPYCKKCGIEIGLYGTKKKAITAWNTRHEVTSV